MFGNIQMQKQDYSQLQKQKQDLVHCNNSFGMLLSSMESLFIKSGYNISVLFGHYNHFNDISWKSKDQIRAQLYTDLMAYKIQKLAYCQKYHKFDYPDYPPIEKIIEIIEKWKKMSKNKDEQNLCDEILDLINDANPKPISYYQGRVENIRSNNRADANKSLRMSNLIHDKIDIRNEAINNQIEKNPCTKFGLEIGRQPGNSEFSNLDSNMDIEIEDPQIIILKNEIIKNAEELFKKSEQFYKLGYSYLFKELKDLYNKVKKGLEIYYSKIQNVDFFFSYFKIDEELRNINQYIKNSKNYADKIEIFNLIKNLIEQFINSYR